MPGVARLPLGGARRQVGALALPAEQGQELRGFGAGVAEPVGHARVELSGLAALQDEVALAQDVQPLVPLVGRLLGDLGGRCGRQDDQLAPLAKCSQAGPDCVQHDDGAHSHHSHHSNHARHAHDEDDWDRGACGEGADAVWLAQRVALHTRLAAAVAPGGTLLVVGHHPTDEHAGVGRWSMSDLGFTAAQVSDALDRPLWDVVADESRPRTVVADDGDDRTVHDVVLVALRRR